MSAPNPLEDLQRLHEAATPGPWSPTRGHDGWDIENRTHNEPVTMTSGMRSQNMALIVVMRNALPALLAVVEAAQRIKDECWIECRNLDGEHPNCAIDTFNDALSALTTTKEEA